MTERKRRLTPPKNLQTHGNSLFRRLTGEFAFNSAELELLTQLCETVDKIAELKQTLAKSGVMVEGSKGQPVLNGVLAALVAHRKLADQLVVALGLPIEGEAVGRRRSAQAKQAVEARWRRTKSGNRIRAVRGAMQGGA
jgi:P27 family predicted phage terminase small subunit